MSSCFSMYRSDGIQQFYFYLALISLYCWADMHNFVSMCVLIFHLILICNLAHTQDHSRGVHMTRDKATIKRLKMYKGGGKRCVVLAVWWAKLEKNDKIRRMTQIASLLLLFL